MKVRNPGTAIRTKGVTWHVEDKEKRKIGERIVEVTASQREQVCRLAAKTRKQGKKPIVTVREARATVKG